MKTRNPKLWLACGQHINASDDNCTDLARHPYTIEEFDNMKTRKGKYVDGTINEINALFAGKPMPQRVKAVKRKLCEHALTAFQFCIDCYEKVLDKKFDRTPAPPAPSPLGKRVSEHQLQQMFDLFPELVEALRKHHAIQMPHTSITNCHWCDLLARCSSVEKEGA